MNILNLKQNFTEALKDYAFLLERGYAPRGFLKLVGNRYQLSSTEKTILYRGVVSETKIKSRVTKAVQLPQVGDSIHIDALNVITTISSYLLGLPVFIARDGFLRDASQKRGNLEKNAKIRDAVQLLLKYLEQFHYHAIKFWLDDTGAATELIMHEIRQFTSNWKKQPKTEISQKIDKRLIELPNGVICTSDSVIIDEADCKVFDLAKHTILAAFNPDFIDLEKTYKF